VREEQQVVVQTPRVKTKPLGREQEDEIIGTSGRGSGEVSARGSSGSNFPSLGIFTHRVETGRRRTTHEGWTASYLIDGRVTKL